LTNAAHHAVVRGLMLIFRDWNHLESLPYLVFAHVLPRDR
jgi:hypothetical protein